MKKINEISSTVQTINDKITETINDIQKPTKAIQDFIEANNKSIKEFQEKIKECYRPFYDINNSINKYYDQMTKQDYMIDFRIDNILITFHDNLHLILGDFENDHRKEQERWGVFGWTPHPDDDRSMYNKPPADRRNAKKIMKKHLNDESMNNLYQYIKNEELVRINDFEESVSSFENKNYKSCCMMLFSLIDNLFIECCKFISDPNEKQEKYRSGIRAIEAIQKKDEVSCIKYSPMIIRCAIEMFKKMTTASEKEYKTMATINRNIILHGGECREIDKIDCLQLFLLYLNTLSFINILYVG